MHHIIRRMVNVVIHDRHKRMHFCLGIMITTFTFIAIIFPSYQAHAAIGSLFANLIWLAE